MKEKTLSTELEKSQKYLIVVEGKKDKQALEQLNFPSVVVLHENGKSLYEKIEEIESIAGKRKVCILTDFDKKGKQLYLLVKKELGTRNVKLDNSLRGTLLKNHISHIEGLSTFIENSRRKA